MGITCLEIRNSPYSTHSEWERQMTTCFISQKNKTIVENTLAFYSKTHIPNNTCLHIRFSVTHFSVSKHIEQQMEINNNNDISLKNWDCLTWSNANTFTNKCCKAQTWVVRLTIVDKSNRPLVEFEDNPKTNANRPPVEFGVTIYNLFF